MRVYNCSFETALYKSGEHWHWHGHLKHFLAENLVLLWDLISIFRIDYWFKKNNLPHFTSTCIATSNIFGPTNCFTNYDRLLTKKLNFQFYFILTRRKGFFLFCCSLPFVLFIYNSSEYNLKVINLKLF